MAPTTRLPSPADARAGASEVDPPRRETDQASEARRILDLALRIRRAYADAHRPEHAEIFRRLSQAGISLPPAADSAARALIRRQGDPVQMENQRNIYAGWPGGCTGSVWPARSTAPSSCRP